MIAFDLPKNQSSIIKVIGVGGGGTNAVNYMHNLGIDGVDFIVCNTDSQSLEQSPVANKITLGPALTSGLGAGANPEIGKQASEESLEDIAKILKVNTKMAFITAGMGGGTGTGGGPVVAKVCRELGVLTVGIVTTPFSYEGPRRMKQAREGIDRMREHVDTILIVSNDKLRQQFGNLPISQGFAKADDVLATATKCITDVINSTGMVNVDFADVCTVMRNGGVAILGHSEAAGENRALEAVEAALNSPLLNDSDIRGAKWILLNITSSMGEHEHTLDEAEAIQAFVQSMAGENCDVILGMGHDSALGEKIAVTLIATGFQHKEIKVDTPVKKDTNRTVMTLGGAPEEAPIASKRDALAPALVEASPAVPKPIRISDEPVKETFTLELKETPSDDGSLKPLGAGASTSSAPQGPEVKAVPPAAPKATAQSAVQAPPVKKEEESPTPPSLNFSLREEASPALQTSAQPQQPQVQPVATATVGTSPFSGRTGYVKTAEEMEEDRRFEEQKRALEERAERLRRLSFNVKATEGSDDMEAVPAYMRRAVNMQPEQASSADTGFSGYSIGADGKGGTGIQTLNTFLEGKKPD